MCSTKLLLWKYQKVQSSTADIFLGIFKFFGQTISENSFKPLIVKGFYLLRMSDDYCFRRAVQGQQSQFNRRNTATVLRTVVKSHKGLKGTKVFAVCVQEEISKISQNSQRRACAGVKLQSGIAYKKRQSKGYLVNFINKEAPAQRLLHKHLPVSFGKNMNTSTRLPLN